MQETAFMTVQRTKQQIDADRNTINHLAEILMGFSPINLDEPCARTLARHFMEKTVADYRKACNDNCRVRGLIKAEAISVDLSEETFERGPLPRVIKGRKIRA
jgi:hypothetical protein